MRPEEWSSDEDDGDEGGFTSRRCTTISSITVVDGIDWQVYRRNVLLSLLVVAAHVFIAFAVKHSFHGAIFPLVVLFSAYLYFGTIYLFSPLWEAQKQTLKPFRRTFQRIASFQLAGVPVLQFSIFAFLIGAFLFWIVIDSARNRIRLRSVAGLFMFVLLSVLISAHPARIKWRPVCGGMVLQVVVGLLVLRWEDGHNALRWASDQVVTFLDYTMVGTAFTYGFVSEPPNICGFGNIFLYTSLQIIIYFGSIVAVLNYLGVIKAVLSKYTIGTTAAESLNAAACIFLGQTEAAILIEPALDSMTTSEIHATMTAGFACIAGSLFSAYISFGACPAYLLSATVMSAAASLAVAKIIYPEVQVSKQKSVRDFQFSSRDESSILECISNGAVHASRFVFEIAANLIVYLALLALLNSSVGYFGMLVGLKDLTFNRILGYCFFPLAYMMGASDASDPKVAVDETLKVAELMGMKTVLNEFIAYQSLSTMISEGTLKGARAQMIATYALCGFSNISMIGSQLGILGSMCPRRKATFAKVVVRALIAGSFACFMTACIAGILVDVPTTCRPSINNNCLDLRNVAEYFKQNPFNKTTTTF